MSKSNFLLVDLNEPKTKKLAETITSETSRKILNYLAEKEDTEQNIANSLSIPISTVHYHLQKLQEAGLVKVEEFHYSSKGREVNHYKLANKYIIIASQKVAGLREKLKGILPVVGIVLGISVILKLVQKYALNQTLGMQEKVVDYAAENTALEAVPTIGPGILTPQPDIALWFLMGGLVSLIIYILITLIKEWRKEE